MKTVSSASYTRSSENIVPDNAVQNKGSTERKAGALASLKLKFANFKNMIAGGEGKKAVLNNLDKPKLMTPEESREAIKNIFNRDRKIANSRPSPLVNNKTAPSGSSKNRPEITHKLLITEPLTSPKVLSSPVRSQHLARPTDSPPPYSLHDPLNASKDTQQTKLDDEDLDALLDDLEALVKKQPAETPVATVRNEKITGNDEPPPYSLHDPLAKQEGPPPPSYIPTPPTLEQLHGPKPMDVHTLRSAITNGLTKALQGERGNLIDKEDIQKFSDNLSISLGLNQGKLSFDQYSAMIVMKSEIDAFLLPDVKSNFDKLMLSLENQLMNS